MDKPRITRIRLAIAEPLRLSTVFHLLVAPWHAFKIFVNSYLQPKTLHVL